MPPATTLALDQLIRHAHLFGTECVYETGEQDGLRSEDLARLRIELGDAVAVSVRGPTELSGERLVAHQVGTELTPRRVVNRAGVTDNG